MVELKLVDVKNICCSCLEETDFENEAERIEGKANKILNLGQLIVPLVVYPIGFNQETYTPIFELVLEENNFIVLLTMITLYQNNPQKWEMVPCWIAENQNEAYVAVTQFVY